MVPYKVMPAHLEQAVKAHWRKVFDFAFRMLLDRDRARQVVEETFHRASAGIEKMPPEPNRAPWLMKIANHVMAKSSHDKPRVTWDKLDETLRSESTRTDLVQSLTDPQHNFLLWELKQGCMTAVVNCLPTGERVAFVLHAILGFAEDEVAMTLAISDSALKVRLSRARKKIADYLAPRCEHINPLNPCHCPSRVGVALGRGFLHSPPNAQVRLRPQFKQTQSSSSDVMTVYRTLPEPDPPDGMYEDLIERVATGNWAPAKQHSHG